MLTNEGGFDFFARYIDVCDVDFLGIKRIDFFLCGVLENIAINKEIFASLEAINILLGCKIIFWFGVMIEVLFVKVEQDSDVWASFDIFELMATELKDYDSLVI